MRCAHKTVCLQLEWFEEAGWPIPTMAWAGWSLDIFLDRYVGCGCVWVWVWVWVTECVCGCVSGCVWGEGCMSMWVGVCVCGGGGLHVDVGGWVGRGD